MLAYMNEDSLKKSIETHTTWFYSRERKKLWNKGEESGNKQLIKR
jgi:phosphoribosyl-AMP cyclohydrolase / phosphoribosyl-ATP pyrophosphohydrolase